MDTSTASAGLRSTSGSSILSNPAASSAKRGSRGERDAGERPFSGAAVAVEDDLTEEDISVKRAAPPLGPWNDEEEDPYVSIC